MSGTDRRDPVQVVTDIHKQPRNGKSVRLRPLQYAQLNEWFTHQGRVKTMVDGVWTIMGHPIVESVQHAPGKRS